LPVTVRAGARYVQQTGAREAFDIELDVVYERWSRVQQIHVATHGLEASYSGGAPLPIPDINLNKHWKDTLTVALGGDFNLIPETFTVRGGVAYDTAVAEPAYTSVDFASGAQLGFGLGASARLGGLQLSAGLEYRVMQTVNVSEQAGRVFQQTPNGTCQPPYTDPNTCHAALIAGQKPAPTVNAGSFDASTFGATLEVAFRF
jgi:long-subunit fatty acid transport protein